MKELEDIVKSYHAACRQGIKTALATVVHVEGSAYRQPGARMLVTETGMLTGAISGGCLEGDALRKAQLVMMQQRPMLVTYDTNDEDDAKLGVGLGCNGIIHILLEPVNAEDPGNPVAMLQEITSHRTPAVLVTLFTLRQRKAPQPGTCLVLTANGQLHHCITDAQLQNAITADAHQALQTRTSFTKTYVSTGNDYTTHTAYIPPAPQLLIAGAGNDVIPLVKMAALLGWHTTVIDGRPGYATTMRFPEATQVITAKPVQVLPQVQTDQYTVAVLMTHNYNYDLALLAQLLPLPLPYIGVLGPAKKLQRMLDELAESGICISPLQRERIHGPAGLDLGAETSEEIALSVISEIKSVLSAAAATSLREKTTAIHSREQQIIHQQQL
ncbi:XdhC family protein [Chitinophaga ginsengisegetis]|uniref:XdhC family protein n=1 Tax=Chitinophaga ginsengisegetis TaxID=393003 RepID=UPI000DBACC74|nr:XdhC/CoxI family protein [Chitinophaga ginsengisegetis]MDR6567217.1 xanthine/CO dehydrogenase XdhC/CoxF family maturation factor [Chitinophaga ginsengisegetis]MDR6646947.1 xanthine/CO dehydrogenase XdhC/CoxF family maturation factor [Chitinophaga ginsengisegetis]MDR6653297.1 xanthine/CO dehydrogenase XdhC/CoxF family maturation factor [Chitinophaga ginsengisegetis]